MITYEKVLKKIQSMKPGEEIEFQHPGSNPYDRALNFYCVVRRCAEDEVAPEYSYLECGEGGWYPSTYRKTDDPEEIAKKVYDYLTK
jgi:hypothetical protein